MWRQHRMPIVALRRRLCKQPLSLWLSPAEALRLSELSSASRRLRWLGGRLLAKHLLRELVDEPELPLSTLHIESRDPRGRPCRPRVLRHGRLEAWQLTISHSKRSVIVAASTDPHLRMGVDIVDLQTIDDRFMRFWFSSGERAWCGHEGNVPSACVLWSLKESWYKAVGGDRPFAPRRIDVTRVTPIRKISGLQFSRMDEGEFTVDTESLTIFCRRFPQEVATFVLNRGGRPPHAEASPRMLFVQSQTARSTKEYP